MPAVIPRATDPVSRPLRLATATSETSLCGVLVDPRDSVGFVVPTSQTSVAQRASTPLVTIATVGLAIAALAATQGSRWYIAPAFTTYLALTLILQGIGERPGLRFAERALETLIGVALALLFGAVIPILIRAARTASQKQVSDGQGSGA